MAAKESDLVEESERHFAAQRYAEAFALVEDALAAAPASQLLLFVSGSILFRWGRFHEALLRYRQAAEEALAHTLELAPESPASPDDPFVEAVAADARVVETSLGRLEATSASNEAAEQARLAGQELQAATL